MAQNPPPNMPRLCPYVFYDDLAAAVGFLERSFGFVAQLTIPGPDGKPAHAQVALGDGVVMMGTTQSPGGLRPVKNPKATGAVSVAMYVFVDDVDRHHAHAKQTGADVLDEPTDMFWGDRVYSAVDPEGHFWTFATRTRDVAPQDMRPGG